MKPFIVTFRSALLLCHSDAERGGGISLASRLAYTSTSICTRLATADSSAAFGFGMTRWVRWVSEPEGRRVKRRVLRARFDAKTQTARIFPGRVHKLQ
jgi:hypothetical protein